MTFLTNVELEKIKNFRNKLDWLKRNSQTIYFDNAATSLKPDIVGEYLAKEINYKNFNHKKLIYAQKICADFFQVPTDTVAFSSGATFSANAIAEYIKTKLKCGDEIILSKHEHGSNIIPWQVVAKKTGAKLIYLDADKILDVDNITSLITNKTKLVTFANCTNLTAQILDAEKLARAVKEKNPEIYVVVDATQFLQHNGMNLKNSVIDFTFGSSHKMFAPNGLGFLVAHPKHLVDMKDSVIVDWAIFAQWFHHEDPCFYQIDFNALEIFAEILLILQEVDLDLIVNKEKELINHFIKNFPKKSGFKILNKNTLVPIFLLNHPTIPAKEISHYLNENNILTRSGLSCAVLAEQVLKTKEVVRVSLSFYNSFEEIDILFEALNNFNKNFLNYMLENQN